MDKYWSERAEASMNKGVVTTEAMLKKMLREYNAIAKLIQKEIEAFIGRYAEQTGLTITEVHKLLTKPELADFREAIKEYAETASKISNGPVSKYYRDKLDRLSTRINISRLQALEASLDDYIIQLGIKEETAVKTVLGTVYESTYYNVLYDLDRYQGYGVPVNAVNTKAIDTVLKEQWAGSNYSDRIWTNKAKLIEQLNTTFLRGVVADRDARTIAKEMSKNLGVAYYNCKRLCVTEMAHILETATLSGYRERGVKKYRILAVLDTKTSDICQAMDGKIFKITEAVEGITYPPFHPNCRTTTIPEIEDYDDSGDVRFARDRYGRGIEVPLSMTYKEWYDKFIK